MATSCRYEIHEGLAHYDLKQNSILGTPTASWTILRTPVDRSVTGVGYNAAAKQVGLELIPAEARASTDFVSSFFVIDIRTTNKLNTRAM